MINVRDLTKVYRKGGKDIVVFDNAVFDIAEGEFVMVLGRSGIGKTTLLNYLGAIDRPDGGTIQVDGYDDILKLSDKNLSQFRNRMIGHIFQTFNLKPTYTAFENVRVPLLFSRISRSEQDKRIRKALDAVGLLDRRSFRPIELSEGQCQRVAIARAIVNRPNILLADEPTGNLDPGTADSIMDLLIGLNSEMKTTLIMVTHDIKILDKADRVFEIIKGKLEEGDHFAETQNTQKQG